MNSISRDGNVVNRTSRLSVRDGGNDLGVWIRTNRLLQHVSQRELADRAGISRSYLCDIERGRGTKPSVEALNRIALALGAARTDVLREAGILEPNLNPQELSREQKLVALFRGLSDESQFALERFARYLLSEEQHWVQPRLVDEELHVEKRSFQTGPGLFDGMDV